jgi:predicted amidohydrolase
MKALLISTLVGFISGNERPPNVDQMHIWFEGPAAHVECDRTERDMAVGVITVVDGDKVSSQEAGTGKVTRRTRCVKFN